MPPPGETPLLPLLHEAAEAVAAALAGLRDWGLAGTRAGQYRSDLVADRAALDVLLPAGVGVFSEESGGHHIDRDVVVVMDPVDGSTNASRGIPWWATSLCAVDDDGPLASLVVNQATGAGFEAERGGGARSVGGVEGSLTPSDVRTLGESIVALNGWPGRYLGWSQYRCLGAAALDLCAVAGGQIDAFIDCAADSLAPWDYLGAVLVCQEAGAAVAEAQGRNLTVVGEERRTVVAAATPELLAEVLEARRSLAP